jgi:predicted phosphate transport protein (TIGR00153 family)
MAFHLIPKDVKFFDLFSADGDNLALAAERLAELVDRWDRLEERIAEIQAIEKRGDELDRELHGRLEDAFITPFDREDMHSLSARLDDVVDGIQAIAETFLIYAVKAPTDECQRLAHILRDQGVELAAALRKLDGMKDITPHLERVTELEHEADTLSRAAIGRLFRDTIEPLEVIKWRDIYGELENAIDAAEDAAEVIERMLHKGS